MPESFSNTGAVVKKFLLGTVTLVALTAGGPANGMIPHHQGAIDIAEIVLKFGKDARDQHFARELIATQRR
jgi:hypothetical protein